jgi:uncharacterized protein (DUF58 family)
MTWEGFLVILLMAVVGLAAWNSGTNLLYLLLATMIGMFLVHGLFAQHSMNHLKIRRHVPQEARAGELVPLAVTLTNEKRFLPAYAVTIRNFLSDGSPAGSGFCAVLKPRQTVDVSVPAIFPHRGWFQLGRLEVTSRFPFGFAERGYVLREEQNILILPPIYPATEVLLGLGLDLGDATGQSKGVGVEPHTLRDYVHGEHVRNIHWKTTARLGKPVVLEYVVEETRQVCLVLSDQCAMDPDSLKQFEKAVVLTASLATALASQGLEVGLLAGKDFMAPEHGDKHMTAILRSLAMLQPNSDGKMQVQSGAVGDPNRLLTLEVAHGAKPDSVRVGGAMVTLAVDQWELVRGEWKPAHPGYSDGQYGRSDQIDSRFWAA